MCPGEATEVFEFQGGECTEEDPKPEHHGDGEVDHRSCDGDPAIGPWIELASLDSGDPADGKQGDVECFASEIPSG